MRYQFKDIDRAVAFHTKQLGFKVEQQTGVVFASVILGNLRLILSGPGSSGSRPMPDGRLQEPTSRTFQRKVETDGPTVHAARFVLRREGIPLRLRPVQRGLQSPGFVRA